MIDFNGHINEKNNRNNEDYAETWKNEINKKDYMKENNFMIVRIQEYNFWKIITILCLIIIITIGYLLYTAVDNDKFKSEFNQNTTIIPQFHNNATIELKSDTINNNQITLNPAINIYPNITVKIDKITCNST